ncbi:S-layer homology domain-containing protein [Dysosmobacter sp.]|uniref:S-layer homology domain-containing protein n=2 Tax=Dysosmobacter sp. TaxID=2591382 RepID=UPI003AF8E6D2
MRRFFRKRLPAFLLTLVMVMTMVPAVSAKSSADLTYEVDKGDSVSFKEREFRDLYRSEYSGDPSYVVFTDYSDLDDYGYLTAVNYYDKTVSLSESDLRNTWFYYDSHDVPKNMDYALDGLTFEANRRADSGTLRLKFEIYDADGKNYVYGTMDIKVGGGSGSSKGDITYTVKPGEEVTFDDEDFVNAYDNAGGSGTMKYVVFEKPSSDYSNAGTVYSRYGKRNATSFTRSELDDYKFYYGDSDYGDYDLDELSFVADKSFSDSIEIAFTAYGGRGSKENDSVSGTLKITSSKSASSSKGDITYTVKAGEEVAFDDADFEKIYENSRCTGSLKYVEFSRPDSAFNNAGTLYSRYGKRNETAFTRSSLSSNKFYYGDSDYGDYDLDELSFVADKSFSGSVELSFTAYGGTGTRTNQNVTGTLVIATGTSAGVSRYVGNIRYNTTPSTALQINANDIARLFRKYTSGEALQYLTLTSVPATGSLYYNYYNTSKYGSAQMPLTASTAGNVVFSYSPASASEYDLSELTYIPSGSNYCTSLGFTGYSSNGTTVSATILISVTASPVSEVYSVTTKGTSVNFPANSVYSAVASATGFGLSSIQLLELPASKAGVLYSGSYAADVTTAYSYGDGTGSMSQLRFIPNSGFTGSVSIPYVALNSSGTAIGSGVVSIGVVDSVKKFTDISTSTWCYKYVTELASANVISGYSNGTFQEKNTITYGAALKLIMLAAGYSEQAPTVKGSTFSGYLAKAKADGLVSGNPKLNGPITRLQIAQIAAKALKLSTTGLPSKKPFTDTNDVYVQALNAAGIIEGYFSNGTSTYKPNNTLTRGQVSAIVWRMKNSVQ